MRLTLPGGFLSRSQQKRASGMGSEQAAAGGSVPSPLSLSSSNAALSFPAEPQGKGARPDPYIQMAPRDLTLPHFLISSSRACEETRAGIIIVTTLQVWRLRRWEVKCLAQSHAANR